MQAISRSRRGVGLGTGLLVAAGLAVSITIGPTHARADASSDRPAISLKVLTFNTGGDEWAGNYHKPDSPKITAAIKDVLRVIRASHADIVGVQEPFGEMRLMADKLGWYASSRLYILSRYPIIEPPGANGYVGYVEVAPGKVVAFADTHLPSYPSGFRKITTGHPRAQVMHIERRTRLRYIRPWLHQVSPLVSAGVPMFFTGDFNSSSWRDWTPAVVRANPRFNYPFRWPLSLAMEHMGFRDSYRQVHPDPLTFPGTTWISPYLDLKPVINPSHLLFRMDFIWNAGAVQTKNVETIGAPHTPDVTVPMKPWPSDHRAVLGTFTVRPVSPPPLVSVADTRVTQGAQIEVTYHRSGPGDTIELLPAGDDVGAPIDSKPAASLDGSVEFETGSLTPGDFDVALVSGGSDAGRVRVSVVPPDATPTLTTPHPIVTQGHRIRIAWKNGYGNRNDWLGVYRTNASNPKVDYYLAWRYVRARVNGALWIGPESHTSWPLGPGQWTVRYCIDDGYACQGSVSFRIHRA
ncbi:MAG: endonuclease/exonuclease/phosphatase family protein [Actinomycetota bacterium]